MSWLKNHFYRCPDGQNYRCICADDEVAVLAPVYLGCDGQVQFVRTLYFGIAVVSVEFTEGYEQITAEDID